MTIQTRFLTQVAAATSEAEIDAVVDAAIRAVARHATTAQIAAACANSPSCFTNITCIARPPASSNTQRRAAEQIAEAQRRTAEWQRAHPTR
jgi:hypothetical protein